MSIDPMAVASLVNTIRVRVQDVKVHKRRCNNLISRCNFLINALRKDCPDTATTPSKAHADALTEAELILETIRERVERWARMDTVRSLLNQGDISEAVDELHRRVDTCMIAAQVKITQELSQAQAEQTLATQRDNAEIRDMILDLRGAFTQYIRNQDVLPSGETFQTVVEEIKEETRDIQSFASLHDAISEDFSESGSFISQSDPFDRAMRRFCRSLVNLELTQPTEVIKPAKPPREKRPTVKKQSSKGSLSLRSLKAMGRRSPPAAASHPQLPPLNFDEEDTTWYQSPFLSVEPSSPLSDRSSLYSAAGTSMSSGSSTISGWSQHTITLRLERQRSGRSSILHTLQPSEPMSPLKVALTTRESVLKTRGPNRLITKATMEGLIHYLLQKPADGDREQHDTFFVAHPAFLAPLNVLAMLIRRFDDALMYPEEACLDNQARVMRLLRDWLKNEHVILADDVLAEMRTFIISVNDSDSESLDELVLDVVDGIQEKTSMNFSPSPITSSFNPAKDKPPTAEQLANAMARMEMERYQRILPIEYTAYAGNLPLYHPNLSAALALSKLIGNWVRASILDLDFIKDPEGLKKRSELKRYFIRTAKACRTIRNFSSSGAIMGALQSKTITCLKATHNRMPSKERQTYNSLVDFLKPNDNYHAYTRYLSKDGSKGCIPWHVAHLQHISKIIGNEEDVDKHHDPPLINFEKWAHLKHQATTALSYRDVPFMYEQQDLGTAMEYLKMGLQSVSSGEDFERVLRRNSDRLKDHEARLYGAIAMQQSGF